MFQLLRVCLVTLAVVRLLPAFSGFLLAFLRLCVWLQLVFGLVQLLSFWSQVDWPDEFCSFLVLKLKIEFIMQVLLKLVIFMLGDWPRELHHSGGSSGGHPSDGGYVLR